MSYSIDSSAIPHTNDDFHITNDHPGPSLCRTIVEDVSRDPEPLQDVPRVDCAPHDNNRLNARKQIRRGVDPRFTSSKASAYPGAITSSFEHIPHPPSLSFERLAFRMDLEDLKQNMRLQKQESFRPYPPPRISGEIIPMGSHRERHPHSQTYHGHRTSAPYSTMKATKKERRLSTRSRRGLGRDSSDGSDHPGELSISLPAVYD